MDNIPSYLPVYEKNFIGRKNELNKLKKLFETEQVVSLYSPPGHGKSSLAYEYAKSVKSSSVAWLTSDSLESLDIACRNYAELLNIKSMGLNLNSVIGQLKTFFKTQKTNVLVVFDNLNRYEYIKSFIENLSSNFKILITTTAESVYNSIYVINLNGFNQIDLIAFIENHIRDRVNEEQIDKIKKISSSNGEIVPIKLERFIYYLKYNSAVGLNKLLNELIQNDADKNDPYLFTLLNLKMNHSHAFSILQFCSFLKFDFIPYSLIEYLNEHYIFKRSNLDLKLNLEALESLAFMNRVNKNNEPGYKMHQSLQEQVRNYAENNKEVLFKIIEGLDEMFETITGDHRNWKTNEGLYLQSNCAISKLKDIGNLRNDRVKNSILNLMIKLSNYEYYVRCDMKKCLKVILKVEKYKPAEESLEYASILNTIGLCYSKLEHHEKSLEYKQRSLSIKETLLSSDDPDLALSALGIGYSLGKIGEFRKSLKYFIIAYDNRKKGLNNQLDHPELALYLSSIAICYTNLKSYKDALSYYLKAYDIRKKYLVDDHPEIAVSLNKIGQIYYYLDDWDNSINFLIQSYEIRKKLYSNQEAHPELVESLENMAKTYAKLNNYKKSVELLLEAYQMKTKLYPANHPSLVYSLNLIGEAYDDLGNLDKSLEYNLKELEMKKKLFENDHPDIADSYNNIGICYCKKGDCVNSIEYFNKAYKMRSGLYGEEHLEVADTLSNIGICYTKKVYKHLIN